MYPKLLPAPRPPVGLVALLGRHLVLLGCASPPRCKPNPHLPAAQRHLVYNKTLGDWRTHNGIDYAAAKGEKVSAPAAGKVTLAGADGSWGPTVAIEDASGRLWRISGVADLKVKAGDTVTAGQALGTVGSVSCECAEDSHIHLEVKQGEKYLDPAKAMQ